MDAKKNPGSDVHRFSGMIFFFSLCFSLGLLIVAFHWRTAVDKSPVDHEPTARHVRQDDELLKEVKLAKEQKKEDVKIKKTLLQNFVTTQQLVAVANNTPVLTEPDIEMDAGELSDIVPIGNIDVPVEKSDSIFSIVEKMPMPVGGVKAFETFIRENLHYPRTARRQGVTGPVKVEFIVNEKGEPVNFIVQSGIGAGCDEEAIRVLSMIKWTPGKQRGRPVKVKMILPLTFQLN